MKKIYFLIVGLLGAVTMQAQELYVFSEPASNMPSNTITPKLKATAGKRTDGTLMQRYTPELMFGFNKNVMVHAGATFSNMMFPGVQYEGAYLYGKYRFLSFNGVHRHFRMAAFTEVGLTRNPMMFDEVTVRGDNSGIEAGLIATQLINNLAVSATGSFLEVFEQNSKHMTHLPVERAVNYSLSAGYLILPFEYRNYEQLNLNVYAELLGQRTFGRESYFVDLAPAVQLIFNSNSKLNLGYRIQLSGNAYRSVEKSFLISFEHTFFNALKRRK